MSKLRKNTGNRNTLERLGRFIKFRILHIEDSPQRIAKGVAIGIFIAWSPFVGLHIVLTLLFSMLLKANKFVSVCAVWICNGFTLIPIFYPNYLMGRYILSIFDIQRNYTSKQVVDFFKEMLTLENFTMCFTLGFWQKFISIFIQIGYELLVGGLFIGTLFAMIMYFITYKIVIWYREKHPHNRFNNQPEETAKSISR